MNKEWDLLDALEEYGDAHGTEAQLDMTSDILREAIERLPGYVTPGFMEYAKEKLEEVDI